MKRADITAEDVFRAVAQQSNLTKSQVRECFKTYRMILEQIADSPNRPLDYSMPLPYVGVITFQRIYNDPNREIKGQIKYVDMSNARPKEQYDRLKFKLNINLVRRVKEISYQRFLKQKEKSKIGNTRQEN